MENFFQRQIERLEFTTKRMENRASEKKTIDSLKLEAKVKSRPSLVILRGNTVNSL